MAQNDMYVVMYKILCYLYDFMKRDVEPDAASFGYVAMGVPERYWNDIVRELFRRHFITGVTVVPIGSDVRLTFQRPRVTMEGVAFMQENTMMAKARDFLISTKAALPIPWL